MSYKVKEIFYSLQGEGANAGRPAVFCRFAGCNLWSGREEDRATAVCQFCDTDFVGTDGTGGGVFATARDLAAAIRREWRCARGLQENLPRLPFPALRETSDPEQNKVPRRLRPLEMTGRRNILQPPAGRPFVICTGGEPLLQLDEALLDALHDFHADVAVETNGTRPTPRGIDWVTVSPKARAPLVLEAGDELKLVFPQAEMEPEQFEHLRFRHFFLQPMDSLEREQNTRAAMNYCLRNPRWRLSLQLHKFLGIR